MKKAVLLITLLFLSPFTLIAQEEEKKGPWSLDTNAAFFSAYMFRGLTLYDGPSIQPSATLHYTTEEYGSFHTNLWVHVPGEEHNDDGKFSEFDATFTYDYSFEDFTVSAGHISITYFNDKDIAYPETAEIYASLALDKVFLTPTFTVFHDYRAYDSQYYQLLLSHTFEGEAGGNNYNLTPFVDLGFASNSEKYFEKNGFIQTTIGVSTELTVGALTVVPSVNYSIAHEDVDDKKLWLGITVSYTAD